MLRGAGFASSEGFFFQVRFKIAIEFKEVFTGKILAALEFLDQSALYGFWHLKSKFEPRVQNYWRILEIKNMPVI
jgi:hypothetical protein